MTTPTKGLLLAVLVAALAVAAAGCGGSDDSDAEAATPSTTAASIAAAGGTAVDSAATEAAATEAPAPSFEGDPIRIVLPYADFFVPPVELAAATCEADTGIPSTIEPVDTSYEDLNLKIQVEAQAGNAPDLAVMGLNTVIPMGSNDFAVDLAPLVAGLEDFDPALMPTLSAGEVDGRLVTIPWGVSLPVLWINTELFTAAGLDPEAPLETWSDLADAAHALADPSKDQYGVAFGMSNGWIPLQFLLQAGTNLLGEDGAPAFDDDAGIQAASFQHDLYESGVAFPGDEEQATTSFVTGKTAIYVATTSFLPTFEADAAFEWSALPFPAASAGAPISLAAGGAGISLFASDERRDAAMELVKCLFAADVLKSVVQDLGYLPVRADLADELLEGVADQPPYAAALSQYDSVVPWYAFPGPDSVQALNVFIDAWTKAVQRSDDPSGPLGAAAEQIGALLP